MSKLSAGNVCWAQDPTGAHPQRPIIVLSHDTHPFSATDCTVMCIGTSAGKYQQTVPELMDEHLDGISLTDTSYLMPWALYTIPPASIMNGKANGKLTEDGRRLLKNRYFHSFRNPRSALRLVEQRVGPLHVAISLPAASRTTLIEKRSRSGNGELP